MPGFSEKTSKLVFFSRGSIDTHRMLWEFVGVFGFHTAVAGAGWCGGSCGQGLATLSDLLRVPHKELSPILHNFCMFCQTFIRGEKKSFVII